jgi:hypothetical protein
MKYVLGLLFEYKYYKNPANIKIFSNNQLIDEIDLTEDINLKNIQIADDNISLYNWCKKWKGLPVEGTDFASELQIPDKSFIYTLDETIVKNSIRIEVTNNNTNYSNGFITRWSSVTFHAVFLIPTYYLNFENYRAFAEKNRQIKTNIHDSLRWPDEHRIVKNGKLELFNWKQWVKGGSFSIDLPIIDYIPEKPEKGLKIIGPVNYEQLPENEKRRLSTNTSMPLYFKRLKLINTQNEAS